MTTVQREFEEDMIRIKSELIFLARMEKRQISIYRDNKSQVVDSGLITMLKAGIYLQLYNVVESNTAKVLVKIHDTINNDTFVYSDLKMNIRILWFANLQKLISKNKFDQAYDFMRDNMNKVNLGDYVHKEDKRYDLSGNIDGRKLKELLGKIGVAYNDAYFPNSLRILKNKRNDLAHGAISFSRAGGMVTLRELYEYHQDVKKTWEHIFENVSNYCVTKSYLVKNTGTP